MDRTEKTELVFAYVVLIAAVILFVLTCLSGCTSAPGGMGGHEDGAAWREYCTTFCDEAEGELVAIHFMPWSTSRTECECVFADPE